MQHNSDTSGHKATPARRRQNPRSTSSPAKRTYASESDMKELVPDYGASPSTPLKTASNTPVPRTQPTNARSKGRNGSYNNNNNNNARPRAIPAGHGGHVGHAPSSPGPTRNGRTTPPDAALRPTAFAGPTFHASPAPSSLPIPSFLAKAMDSPKVRDSGRASQEPSPPATDSEAPTPQHPGPFIMSPQPTVPREESPLEFLLQARRAEQEKERRASSAHVLATAPGSFSPPNFQTHSPQAARTAPRGPATTMPRRNLFQRNTSSSGGIPTKELDGTPGQPLGPAFSTPYQDRIRAARSNDRTADRAAPANQHHQPSQTSSTNGQTEALKNFLGIGNASPSAPVQSRSSLQTVTSPPVDARAGLFGHPIPPQVQQWPIQQQSLPTTQATGQGGDHEHEMKRLEDKLRQTLGLL